ncbi:hypothetical protein M8J75_008965 [Diaphorina citri]|nr:hypothetical protein M8J75_008965 [Diaphorina citri]
MLICTICPFKTTIRSQFDQHIKIHRPSENKPSNNSTMNFLYCNVCSFKTLSQNDLQFHKNLHGSTGNIYKAPAMVMTPMSRCSSPCSTSSSGVFMSDMSRASSPSTSSYGSPQNSLSSKLYSCGICEFKTSNITELENHNLHTHSKPETNAPPDSNYFKPYCCNVCGFKTSDSASLGFHVKTHYEKDLCVGRELDCQFCHYRGKNKTELKAHYISIHSKDKLFKCYLCSYSTGYPDYLNNHIRSIHTGEKPFECKVCEFKSASKQGLYYHWKQSGHKIKYALKNLYFQ